MQLEAYKTGPNSQQWAVMLAELDDVASEHGEVWRRFKRGKLDGATASRMSAILVNHRTIIETVKAEERIQELEQMVVELKERATKGATLRVV